MDNSTLHWQPGALERLKSVPFFIRPFVKARIEKVARSRDVASISEALIDEIKNKEMPK